jgi:hypothetical protein
MLRSRRQPGGARGDAPQHGSTKRQLRGMNQRCRLVKAKESEARLAKGCTMAYERSSWVGVPEVRGRQCHEWGVGGRGLLCLNTLSNISGT